MAILVAGLLLSACQWPQPGYGPEHRRHNVVETDLTIDNVDSLAVEWSMAVPGARTEPIVADDRIYVTRHIDSSPDGAVWVRALGTASGQTIWERQLGSGQSFTLPNPNSRFGDRLSVGYNALVSGRCQTVQADLDPATGSGEIVTGVERSPAVTSGSMVVRTATPLTEDCNREPAKVTVTDSVTGAERWSGSLGPGSFAALPTVADGRVFLEVGSALQAFALDGCGSATCSPLWSTDLAAPVRGPVAGHQGQVFVLAEHDGQTDLVAVSATDGTELWRAEVNFVSFSLGRNEPLVAVAGDVVYLTTPGDGTDANQLKAFAAGGCGAPTCSALWSASLTSQPSAPTVAGGVVYVGTEGVVEAYDAAGCGSPTCSPTVSVPTKGWAADLSVAGGRLYAVGGDHVTAFAPTERP